MGDCNNCLYKNSLDNVAPCGSCKAPEFKNWKFERVGGLRDIAKAHLEKAIPAAIDKVLNKESRSSFPNSQVTILSQPNIKKWETQQEPRSRHSPVDPPLTTHTRKFVDALPTPGRMARSALEGGEVVEEPTARPPAVERSCMNCDNFNPSLVPGRPCSYLHEQCAWFKRLPRWKAKISDIKLDNRSKPKDPEKHCGNCANLGQSWICSYNDDCGPISNWPHWKAEPEAVERSCTNCEKFNPGLVQGRPCSYLSQQCIWAYDLPKWRAKPTRKDDGAKPEPKIPEPEPGSKDCGNCGSRSPAGHCFTFPDKIGCGPEHEWKDWKPEVKAGGVAKNCGTCNHHRDGRCQHSHSIDCSFTPGLPHWEAKEGLWVLEGTITAIEQGIGIPARVIGGITPDSEAKEKPPVRRTRIWNQSQQKWDVRD